MNEFIKKHYPVITLVVIMILAFAVRFYHFEEWLYFKWDQGRDAMVIANAIENGPGELPLLGPRVARVSSEGEYLRLGPAYYYLQYISGAMFGTLKPETFAYPDLFFSIAVIPLLYILFRLYFSRQISLVLVTLFSFSFIIIQYSRFSWNPNPVPFFSTAAFLGLLKFTHSATTRKGWWVALWAVCLAIASQLHMFAGFVLIGSSTVYLAIRYQLWNIKAYAVKSTLSKFAKYAAIAAISIGIIYSPVIISDIMRGGENSVNFFRAFGVKPAKKPFSAKAIKNIKEESDQYFLILTGKIFSEADKKASLATKLLGGLFMLSGTILAVWQARKSQKEQHRNFLTLLVVTLVMLFLIAIPMAFQLSVRFFVTTFFIPYVFIGLWYLFIKEKIGQKVAVTALLVGSAILLGFNLRETYAWFGEQKLSQEKRVETQRTRILKRKDGITLGQMNRSVDYIYQAVAGQPLAMFAKAEYYPPYNYLFYIKDKNFTYTRINFDKPERLVGINHLFVIDRADSPLDKSIIDKVDVLESRQFGQVAVHKIAFKPGVVPSSESIKKTQLTKTADEEVELDEEIEEEIEEEAQTEKPAKPDDRLYWKDVL